MRTLIVARAGVLLFAMTPVLLARSVCDAPPAEPSTMLSVPGQPFGIVLSRDGCRLFASLVGAAGKPSGIAVLERAEGRLSMARFAPLPGPAFGMVLTHDEKQLIVAANDAVHVLDTARLVSGTGDPLLGSFHDGPRAFSINVNITRDDRTLFVSDEYSQSITVIDYARARREGFSDAAIIGKIPVGSAPIALVFSRNEKLLYTTSQVARQEWGWPAVCTLEAPNPLRVDMRVPEGAVVVIDVAAARRDPATAVSAKAASGCNPVRLAMQRNGKRIYVTSRHNNSLFVFQTKGLQPAGEVAVGTAPVPVISTRNGKRIIVGNSNRFGTGGGQTLSVVDGKRLGVSGTLPAGQFPRDLRLSRDEKTLFVANFGSSAVQMVDLRR